MGNEYLVGLQKKISKRGAKNRQVFKPKVDTKKKTLQSHYKPKTTIFSSILGNSKSNHNNAIISSPLKLNKEFSGKLQRKIHLDKKRVSMEEYTNIDIVNEHHLEDASPTSYARVNTNADFHISEINLSG